jgi:hypothetical protein
MIEHTMVRLTLVVCFFRLSLVVCFLVLNNKSINGKSLIVEGQPMVQVSTVPVGSHVKSRLLQETLNITECKGYATIRKKLYLSDYSDYIMRTATIYIITNKGGGTLDTANLEGAMLNSDGGFKACDDYSFNPNFPSWKTTLPKSIIRTFAQYSCQYYNYSSSQDGYMDQFCNNEGNLPASEFPSDGYIFMRSSEVNRTRRREIAADLCNSFQYEWDPIISNMTHAYLEQGLVTTNSSTWSSSSSNTTTTTIPIGFFIRTPIEYSTEETSAKVISILQNSFNSLLDKIYSSRLRLLQGTTDHPVVASVQLISMNPVDCNKSYANTMKCYDIDSAVTVDLNNRSAKKLKKKLLLNPPSLQAADNVYFYKDLATLQSSAMPSKSNSGMVWGIILSVVGTILLSGVIFLIYAHRRKSNQNITKKFSAKGYGKQAPTPPISPNKEHEGEDENLIEDMSIEFQSQQSPIREYCIDIQSSQRPWNEENPLPNFHDSKAGRGSTDVSQNLSYATEKDKTDKSFHSSSSVFDTSKSVAKSVYSAIELVLTKEPNDQSDKRSPEVATKDFSSNKSSALVVVSAPSATGAEELKSPDTALAAKVFVADPSKKRKQKSKWAMALDESSGEKYYYNRITKETTWDRPASFDGDDQDESIPVFPKINDSAASAVTPTEDPSVIKKKKEIEAMLNKISPFEEHQNKVLLKTFAGKEDLLLLQLKESTNRISGEAESTPQEQQAANKDGDIALPLNKVTSTATNFSVGTQRMSNTSGKSVFRLSEDAATNKLKTGRQVAPRSKQVGSLYNLDESVQSEDSDTVADAQKASNSFYDDSSVSELSGFTDKSSDESDSTSDSGGRKKRAQSRGKKVSQIEKKKAQLKFAVHKKDWKTASTVAVWLQGLNNRGRKVVRSVSRESHVYSFRSHAELEENFDRLLLSNDMDAIVALIDSMSHVDAGMNPRETKFSGLPQKSLGARSKLQHVPEKSRNEKAYSSRESPMLV